MLTRVSTHALVSPLAHRPRRPPSSRRRARPLRAKLLALVTADDNTFRHHWSVGDVAIWDNRSMLHKAQGFDERHARVMHHVRVAGFEAPIAWQPS